jgi:hypothetical protein
MNLTKLTAAIAFAAAATCMSMPMPAIASLAADSTGAISQSRGELLDTPSGISASVLTPSTLVNPPEAGVFAERYSTGGSSAARAAFLLDHAHVVTTWTARERDVGRFQPYLDSTGGRSMARAAIISTPHPGMSEAQSGSAAVGAR